MDHAPSTTADRPLTRRRRLLLLVGMLVLLATAALAADIARQRAHVEAVAWSGPAELAQPADRPTLVRFTADWCPPCQAMKRDVFSRTDLANELTSKYRAVSVDLTDPGPADHLLGQTFAVAEIPTFIVVGPDGTETARLVGFADAKGFTAFLRRHAGD